MIKNVFYISSREKYLTHLQNTLNMFKRIGLLIFLLLGTSHIIFSQITISSPVLRQVFQRDLNNQATVTITGSYSQPVDTIQVRFLTVTAGQGTSIGWTVIKSAPLGGLFKGSVVVKGGWYSMEVRGLLNGRVVGNVSTLSRVGVGEVFIIGGQSNAGGTGERSSFETGASDDRVNCADFYNINADEVKGRDPTYRGTVIDKDATTFSLVQFAKLEKTSAIGPRGLGPFYWGKVGDALATKLNVPILFFNVAWGGASARVWAESASFPEGKLVNGRIVGPLSDVPGSNKDVPGSDFSRYYDPGTPYKNLNAILRYYGINLGVRSILWMQGETENVLNLDSDPSNNVTTQAYINDLETLLKKTRQDLGNNKLSWVIARTSYSGTLGCGSGSNSIQQPSPIIVSGQNQVIANPTNFPIYSGPFTDNIQVPRSTAPIQQCVHFSGTGLNQVAAAWIKSLTEDNKNFFETVEPIPADTIPSVSLNCISNTQLQLSLPEGYRNYDWFNKSTNQSYSTRTIVGASGTYVARVTRSNGNIIQVPDFTVRANTPAKAPIVTALSDVNFCLGTSVTLQSTTEADNPIYEWVSSPSIGNLPRTKDIAASREGTYRLRVIDKNACASPYSSDVKLIAKPRPEKPTISTSGSTEFCDGQSITLTSSNVGATATSYEWSNGENTRTITVRRADTYNVLTIGANGCKSLRSTDNIVVIVNPIPATPQIRALTDTVFCDGGSVSLVSTPADGSSRFGWERNGRVITADNANNLRVSGTELVRGFVINANNCNSRLSNAIQVVKKDNPSALTIIPKSTYSLVARSDKKAEEYTWKLDGKILTQKDSLIRTIDKGSYTVIGKNSYRVRSSNIPLVCQSAESVKLEFAPYDDNGISVFPNPSNGIFNLESRYDLDKVNIMIYTIDGKLVYEKKLDVINLPKSLNLSSFTEGTYVLRIENSTYKISKLLRIER
ncbi:MAG: T9SS type A sorting domain-containing protein [Arcicella sp.]|nr:T9SS type A sorting domain-containing protein [Arcicella sp.]